MVKEFEGEKKKCEIEDKISIFGALGLSKPVRKMIEDFEKQRVEIEKENLVIQREIAKSVTTMADVQKAQMKELSRIAFAVEKIRA